MFYRSLGWSTKWKLGIVPSAPSSWSSSPAAILAWEQEATPQGYDLKWQPLNHFLKVSQGNPSEYTPKTPKTGTLDTQTCVIFWSAFPLGSLHQQQSVLVTPKIPVPAWLHLWVLWTCLHGVQGCGWVNITCLWSEGCFSLTGQLGCSETLAQISSIHTESSLSPNIHNSTTNRPFCNPTSWKYL